MAEPVVITDGNFEEEVLNSDIPVLIDFWAEWCAPCHMIAPVVQEIANEYEGKLKVGKVDVDSNPQVASQLQIRSIPSLIFFKGGKVAEQIIGAVPKRYIKDMAATIVS